MPWCVRFEPNLTGCVICDGNLNLTTYSPGSCGTSPPQHLGAKLIAPIYKLKASQFVHIVQGEWLHHRKLMGVIHWKYSREDIDSINGVCPRLCWLFTLTSNASLLQIDMCLEICYHIIVSQWLFDGNISVTIDIDVVSPVQTPCILKFNSACPRIREETNMDILHHYWSPFYPQNKSPLFEETVWPLDIPFTNIWLFHVT